MTIETLRGKAPRGRAASKQKPSHAATLAIGEQDANIFNCPSCARPLGVGASRCPECGTRLIAGVQATRAVAFIGLGWILGAMIGGGAMAGFVTLTRPADAALVEAPPVTAASAAPAPTTAPVASRAPAIDPGIPSAALSALSQTSVLNGRIAAGAERLDLALASGDTGDIARALRAIAADAAFGDRLAAGMGAWTAAATLAEDLTTFYGEVGALAHDGLSASLANERAYVQAGESMLALVAGLSALDDASRDLAAIAGIELPPIDGATAP